MVKAVLHNNWCADTVFALPSRDGSHRTICLQLLTGKNQFISWDDMVICPRNMFSPFLALCMCVFPRDRCAGNVLPLLEYCQSRKNRNCPNDRRSCYCNQFETLWDLLVMADMI